MIDSSPKAVITAIDALNKFILSYHKGSCNKPRSWDDTLLFRKYQFPSSLDLSSRQRAAVVKFARNGHRMKQDLVLFENLVEYDLPHNLTDQAVILHNMRKLCHDIFRPWSKPKIHNTVNKGLEFPKGAGFLTKRSTTRNERFKSGICVTASALSYAYKHLRTDVFEPNQGSRAEERNISIVPGNRYITVPKDAETERLICIEPEVNSYYQKGIGSWLKSVVKDNFGIDLSNQDRNRTQCADFAFSTIDLSSASDSVSNCLVEFLLPARVFNLLKAFRSGHSQMFDHAITHDQPYSMFSTMGNGFTFELESLIFAIIARVSSQFVGCDASEVTVFGDDIIVRNEAADVTMETLVTCGFIVNDKKSFWGSDDYRESCGQFFERSADHVYLVSPLALKKPFLTSVSVLSDRGGQLFTAAPLDPELIRVHNEMLRYVDTTCMTIRNDKLHRFYLACIKKIRNLYPAGFVGRGYFDETQYLLADTRHCPTHELCVDKKRLVRPDWSIRLLGQGLYGPPDLTIDLDFNVTRVGKLHRSNRSFGSNSCFLNESSSYSFVGFIPADLSSDTLSAF